jgi:hypothetical protein
MGGEAGYGRERCDVGDRLRQWGFFSFRWAKSEGRLGARFEERVRVGNDVLPSGKRTFRSGDG